MEKTNNQSSAAKQDNNQIINIALMIGAVLIGSAIAFFAINYFEGQGKFDLFSDINLFNSQKENRAMQQIDSNPSMTPKEVVRQFYNWYLSYEGEVLEEEAYKRVGLLSTNVISSVEKSIESYQGVKNDPFFCSQGKPSDFTVREAEINQDKAKLKVELTMEYKQLTIPIELRKSNREWQIFKINCSQARPSSN